MTQGRRAVGQAGEDAVAAWYLQHGYEVVARNWRVREGEIDVIARTGRTVVFCEVKARRSDAFGTGFEAVTPRKQLRLRDLARRWLAETGGGAPNVRFDVAAVTPNGRGWDVDVIEGAF